MPTLRGENRSNAEVYVITNISDFNINFNSRHCSYLKRRYYGEIKFVLRKRSQTVQSQTVQSGVSNPELR